MNHIVFVDECSYIPDNIQAAITQLLNDRESNVAVPSLTPLSDAMKEIAAEQGLDIVDVPCSEVEPEDLIGLPDHCHYHGTA